MRERVDLPVDELIWHPQNRHHIRRHGCSIRAAEEVRAGGYKVFSQEGRTGTHQMIGRDGHGRFWTIVINVRREGLAAPVTAWPSRPRDIRLYEESV